MQRLERQGYYRTTVPHRLQTSSSSSHRDLTSAKGVRE